MNVICIRKPFQFLQFRESQIYLNFFAQQPSYQDLQSPESKIKKSVQINNKVLYNQA